MFKQIPLGFLLILLVCFLILPKACSAVEKKEISPEQIEKYLELPERDVKNLLHTLTQVFTTDWIHREASGYSTVEEKLVPLVLRRAVSRQVLNHLLVDAPFQATWGIVNNAVKIARLMGAKDISVILKELEKESVEKATEYGMKFLLQNKIRVTPGTVEFSYTTQKREQRKVIFQYVLIYQPINKQRGKVVIRFYSPNPIDPPRSQGSYGGMRGMPNSVQHNLSPFIVEITGRVEKDELNSFWWIDKKGRRLTEGPNPTFIQPSVRIDFSQPVPDLGIKPLSFWERRVLKPIQTTIREVETIITKVTGGSTKIVENFSKISEVATNIWNTIKSTISQFNPFEAAVAPMAGPAIKPEIEAPEGIPKIGALEVKEVPLDRPSEANPRKVELGSELTREQRLAQIQEILDDIAERIDVISQKVAEAVQKHSPEKLAEAEISETEEISEEIEKAEELQEEMAKQKEVVFCNINTARTPAGNRVIFNEIAWMGSVPGPGKTDREAANNEWIELRNISGTAINLTGWQVLDKDNQIKIIFKDRDPASIISANGFLLLERTNDDTVAGVGADFIYTGGLSNSGEALYLFDENCRLQDETIANPNWPAGDNTSKRTMERRPDLTWQTSVNPGGTPRRENSSGHVDIVRREGGAGTPAPAPASAPAPAPTELPKILISEVQIEGDKISHDFIELYNSEARIIDISGFQLKKRNSAGNEDSVRVLPGGSIIPARGYFLWVNSGYALTGQIPANTTSTQTLAINNSIALLGRNENIIDALSWGSSTDPFIEGQSFLRNPTENRSLGRKRSTTTEGYIDTDNNSADFEIQAPTPGARNQSPLPEEEKEKIEVGSLSVVINEIAWMGTRAHHTDEWIELFNNTTSTIDIAGWRLVSSDRKPDIIFSTTTGAVTTTISAQGFYLIERTNNDTTSELADWIGSFGSETGMGLGNNPNCEVLSLFDREDRLIDKTICLESGDWPAGKAHPNYISMERINPLSEPLSESDSDNWASNNLITRNGKDAGGNNINGTPKAPNSVSISPTTILTLPFNEFSEITLTYLGSPYIVGDHPHRDILLSVPQGRILNIESGVILKFNNNASLKIYGTLKAIGEERKKIVFTTLDDNLWSSWDGMHFASSTNSELRWTRIKYGNRKIEPRASPTISARNSSIILKNSVLENYYERGLLLINSSSTIENVSFLGRGYPAYPSWFSHFGIKIQGGSSLIKNCLVRGNRWGIFISGTGFIDGRDYTTADVTIEGNNFEANEYAIHSRSHNAVFKNNRAGRQDNYMNGIVIFHSIYEDVTWFKNDIPYILYYPVRGKPVVVGQGSVLTINPGVVIRGGHQNFLKVKGRLIARGTVEEPIVFTFISGFGTGNWGGLAIISGEGKSILKNVRVSYGGAWHSWSQLGFRGSVWIKNTEVEIENLFVRSSGGPGLVSMNSNSTIKNSHFENNERGLEISSVSDGKCPQVENLTFRNNKFSSHCCTLCHSVCERIKAWE